MSTPIWTPSADRIEGAVVTRFRSCVNARLQLALTDYKALEAWSLENPAAFWRELARFSGTIADWGDGPVLEHGGIMPGARWFPTARLNFAENLLRHRDDHAALIFVNERGTRRELSRRALHAEVARVADGLRALGVGVGDRVAGYMPNLPETIVAMLATTSLGAVWSSCSPDFGVNGVLDRFGQITPKVLFTADGYFYAGKQLDSLAQIAQIAPQLPGLEAVVVVSYMQATPDIGGVARAVPYASFGRAGTRLSFEQLPFDHPLYILYSSGTTGKPKCIVHGAGGTLLQHQKEHLLHTDLRPDDRFFYYTTCGWMMWNWLASGLASGAALVLYEGSPFHPGPHTLWDMAAAERIAIFGASAKYLAALDKAGFEPAREVDVGALRAVLSTGSPLLPQTYDYVYRAVKADLQLSSISGGTDIVSCFCLGSPVLPVRRGEIQCRGLGMRTEVFDEAGARVIDQRGELVCAAPFPSMPVGFWNDPDGSRYREAYFSRFPNTWHHGDDATETADGGFVIFGRSDAVLNPGGVRIGTAEIYRQVEQLPEVLESLAIGQQWEGDVRVVLFVRLREGVTLDDALVKRIRDTIRRNTTPRHVPAKVIAVADLPRTLSGKLVELAVRNVVHGKPVLNRDALANPAALDLFRDLPELAD
ncbi:MAG TPA: acetoacetate--CoA ligase [Steroidobacteraceae bacterium]|nr:acetoacetate--CoA ligase [Steroidobacteraceae bacterium]HNS27299.1 acetoacetate--CoA ligase [Steroidobacteraceae bacterium]